MSLKLTLTGADTDSGAIDIDIDVPADLTVGALAAELAERSPHHRGEAVTLALRYGSVVGTPLDPSAGLHEVGILSGAVVEFVSPTADFVPPTPGQAAAVAVVVSGPDAGSRFPLRSGSNLIGRDPSCDIVLSDDMVSRKHARIEVGNPVEVIDLGSVNGTVVAGSQVPRAHLEATTNVTIGDTTLRIHVQAHLPPADTGAFVRSPPVGAAPPTDEIVAPVVPRATKGGRIPVLAALAPVLLGAVMFALTRRVETLIFIALSPVLLIGNAVESRLSGRRGAKQAAAKFRTELEAFEQQGRERLAAETTARRAEHPDLVDLVEHLRERTPTLWSRRPDGDHFAELRVGSGRLPTRTEFSTPPARSNDDDRVADLDDALQRARAALTHVDDVPVVVDLPTDGSIGVAGPLDQARAVAASMVASATLLHSPAELGVTLLSSEAAAPTWEWLKWLPHVDAQYSPIGADRLACNTPGCVALHGALMQLLELRQQARSGSQRVRPLPVIVVIVEHDAPIERALLVELLELGPDVGIHTIWVADAVERLPAGCGAVVDIARPPNTVTPNYRPNNTPDMSSSRSLTGPFTMSLHVRRTRERTEPVRADLLDGDDLVHLARALSPVIDTGARVRDDSGLPDVVLGPELLGLPAAAPPERMLERWAQTSIEAARQHDTGLRAAVGVAGTEPFVLDLRSHGPHALVGGTTGAGKSEFLQSWVMGLATSYSSQRVNFLFVDYKGGSAFSECVKLPHCVGLVTDLSPHLVDRALTSLHAELHRREHLFAALDAKDIHDLERRGAPETPPALVIVVDEFAALVQEVPEFVNGVVNVAQRGRSLGLHLILATQRPAGVITGNLRANTNIRVALRMADESDSSDVIDIADAAFIDARNPGRGFAKVGPGRTHAFQSSFFGGWSSESSSEVKITVRPLGLQPSEPWPAKRKRRSDIDTPNDLAQLVAATQRAALVGNIAVPRRPWLPELGTHIDLRDAVLTRSDAEIVFGTGDLPAEQAQPPISFLPDSDGNLAVFGTSGSGKSTLLRTLAMVAGSSVEGVTPSSGPCHVYCLDFGSRSLQPLEDFGHVGAVINSDDDERIVRLFRQLRTVIDERQVRYRAADADTISQYRERTGNTAEPRVLLLVDNFGAFRQAYDAPDRAATLDMFLSIMADGRSAGVHVVISADRPGALPSAITSMIPRRLVLRLANESDYLLLGERADILGSDTPPGRGIEAGREFQAAVLGGTANVAEQTRLARSLARHDGFVGSQIVAPTIRRLPQTVALDELPVEVDGRPVLGVEDATLSPIGFEPTGAFVIAGAPGSGRTTAMATMALSLGRWRPDYQRVLFAERRSSLGSITTWTTVASRPTEHATIAAAIAADLKQADGEVSGLAIFIENAPELLEATESEAAVIDLIKTALTHDVLVVIEGETSQLARAWKLENVRNQRNGLVLQPQTADGDLLKASFPRIGRNEFPVGRAMVVNRRQVDKVQVATPRRLSP